MDVEKKSLKIALIGWPDLLDQHTCVLCPLFFYQLGLITYIIYHSECSDT